MNALWTALGETMQPVLISVVTLAVVALLRLVTPGVRWSRRLKHDADVLNSLPEGKERELWATSVIAQAERLRIYREDQSPLHRLVDVNLVISILAFGVLAAVEVAGAGLFSGGSLGDWAWLPWVALAFTTLGLVTLIARLVMGLPLTPGPGHGGHYPKYAAVRAAETRRKYDRIFVEERLNEVMSHDQKARRKEKRLRVEATSPSTTDE